MKRLLLILVSLLAIYGPVMADRISDAFNRANAAYSAASTPAACDQAAAKFRSITSIPGYKASLHKSRIDAGVKKCNDKKKRLQGGGSGAAASNKPNKPSTPNKKPVAPAPASSISKLVITDISFVNTDQDQETISGPGFYFNYDDIQYICPKIYYSGLTKDTDATIQVKYYNPSGDLLSSNGKYTYEFETSFYSGDNTKLLVGWGNDNGGTFRAGKWRCEIWSGSKKLSTGYFTVSGSGSGDGVDYSDGRYVKINSVSVEHNQYRDGVKGMLIHANIDAVGMKDHKIYVAAYFYYDDGTPLKDIDGNFSTPDGQVCVHDRATVLYDSSNFGDFQLFIPNDQIEASDANLKFYVRAEDDTLDDKTVYSEWQYFSIGNPD